MNKPKPKQSYPCMDDAVIKPEPLPLFLDEDDTFYVQCTECDERIRSIWQGLIHAESHQPKAETIENLGEPIKEIIL